MQGRTRKPNRSTSLMTIQSSNQPNPELQSAKYEIETQILNRMNLVSDQSTWQKQYLELMIESGQYQSKLNELIRAVYRRNCRKEENKPLIKGNSLQKGWIPFVPLTPEETQRVVAYQSKLIQHVLEEEVPIEFSQEVLLWAKESPIQKQYQKQKHLNLQPKNYNQKISRTQTVSSFNSRKENLIVFPKSKQFF